MTVMHFPRRQDAPLLREDNPEAACQRSHCFCIWPGCSTVLGFRYHFAPYYPKIATIFEPCKSLFQSTPARESSIFLGASRAPPLSRWIYWIEFLHITQDHFSSYNLKLLAKSKIVSQTQFCWAKVEKSVSDTFSRTRHMYVFINLILLVYPRQLWKYRRGASYSISEMHHFPCFGN